MKISLLIFFLILLLHKGNTQSKDSIIPYSFFLNEIEKGKFDINYQEFRISYIYSNEFKNKGKSDYDSLKKEVYKNIQKNNYAEIINTCNKMLEIDYTSMFAHKYLQMTGKFTNDTTLYKKHHALEFGLLKSIVHNGDGKSCKTSWMVTQLEEEYFILKMQGAELKKQIYNGCDVMIVKEGRKKRTYYFDVYYVFLSRKL